MSDDTRTIRRSVQSTGLVLARVAFFLLFYSGILFAKNVYMKETLTLNKCNVRKIAIVGEFTFSFIHPVLRKSCASTRGRVDIRHRPLLCTRTFALLLLVLIHFFLRHLNTKEVNVQCSHWFCTWKFHIYANSDIFVRLTKYFVIPAFARQSWWRQGHVYIQRPFKLDPMQWHYASKK